MSAFAGSGLSPSACTTTGLSRTRTPHSSAVPMWSLSSSNSRPSTSLTSRPITSSLPSPVSSRVPRPAPMTRASWSRMKNAAFGAG